jgi:peptide/nickel transport system permease protein
MLRHILPNVFSAALIFAMVDAVNNILLGAALGYFGLGVPQPNPEWGSMIADGQQYMMTEWWVPALPGLAIVLVGVALSLIGDGIADVLRPNG